MSSSIWTRCAGDSEVRPLRLSPWRAVEAQHQVSTRKLVDTVEEQAVLEDLIEGSKPPDSTRGRLHYLLYTPFRYPPLRHGSRFGGRHERGIWYGADEKRTVFAEVAYYRLLFLEGTVVDLGAVTTHLTAFTVRVRTDRGIDLAMPPFDTYRAAISSPTDYATSQTLGTDMRGAGVEVVRYVSARDVEHGTGVGVFSPAAFGAAKPRAVETWHCTATRDRVELVKRDYFEKKSHTFPRGDFLADGRLPAPAV
ncbi:MAG TPA: RES family NAD+ phosphorylase [Longimicrobiales bacterium]|nr:RES family NAD+ phosphorylase [Longimicrobiales bacterium]